MTSVRETLTPNQRSLPDATLLNDDGGDDRRGWQQNWAPAHYHTLAQLQARLARLNRKFVCINARRKQVRWHTSFFCRGVIIIYDKFMNTILIYIRGTTFHVDLLLIIFAQYCDTCDYNQVL